MKISDSNPFVWCVDCSYIPYTFELCLKEKKKERKKERRKKNKIEIFAFDFLDC